MSEYETVLVDHSDSILTITLNRPERLNALTDTVAREIVALLKQAARADEIRCLVITGAGKGFCAGQDLEAFQSRSEGDSIRKHLEKTYHPMVTRIRALEKPVIAAVNGACAGAGLGLALACDIRYASDKARFLTAFIGIGLAPDSGTTYWLPRLIGPARAAELFFTNDRVDAAAAERMGLVNRVVPADELQAVTRELARRLAQAPTKAIGLGKRALNRSLDVSFEEALDYEAHLQEVAARTQDFVEGVTAFTEKRPPNFVGK
ncbi:MAG: enoyl-CoA hydratase/isomerase family protein [Anaerolineales bacterium]